MVTFPIGLSVSKVQRIGILPIRFAVQGQYMPVHPDVFSQKWNLQVTNRTRDSQTEQRERTRWLVSEEVRHTE